MRNQRDNMKPRSTMQIECRAAPTSILPDQHPEHQGLFVAVVYGKRPHQPSLPLTMGLEATEEAAMEWGREAMRLQPWIDGNPCPPDIFDRGERAMPNPDAGKAVVLQFPSRKGG